MAKGRMLKASTIFEKAKRSHINNSYSKGGYGRGGSYYDEYYSSGYISRFSGLSFFKRPDIIKPHLHYTDARIAENSVKKYLESKDLLMSKATSAILKDVNKQRQKKGLGTLSSESYQKELMKIYAKFPESLINDIQNQFYSDNYSLQYEDRTEKNKNRFKILDRINDPVSKIITNSSHLKSMIYTRYMVQYFLSMMLEVKDNDQDAFNQFMNNLNNSGADSSDSSKKQDELNKTCQDILDRYFDDKKADNKIEEFKQAAKNDVDTIEQTFGKEEAEQMWAEGDAGSKSLPIELKSMFDEISQYNMNMQALKEPLTKIIEKASSKFQSEKEYFFDSFIDDPMVSELIDHAYLHPKLRKLFIEDLQIKDFKTFGKIDIYVDVSGSMSGSCGFQNLTRIRFAQVLLYKLIKMDIVDKTFLFNNTVKEIKTDIKTVMKISTSGGTSFNSVVRHMKERDANNVLMITDCEDSLSSHLSNLFVLGLEGSRFGGFPQEYRDNKQLIYFSGTEVKSIN